MKVLWITNIIMPSVCRDINLPCSCFGGWLEASALSLKDRVNLSIATIYSGEELFIKDIDGINYILLPSKTKMYKYDSSLEVLWKKVKKIVNPDIVHIHGTEYPYGLSYLKACGNSNVLVSIQGLLGECAKHYFDGISKKDIFHSLSFSSFIMKQDLFSGQREFKERSLLERQMIINCENFAGRTKWDQSIVRAVNPSARYFFIGESLRKSFYTDIWDKKNCIKHSIFLSQAGYPIKGLHIFLKALVLVKQRFPDVKVRIAGPDITLAQTWKQKILQSGYARMLIKQILKFQLRDHIEFLGPLDENMMKAEYLKTNVFVCPSSLENSPNSLAEAQILGTPCIASFVGGVPDMVLHKETGFLYRFEDYSVLAAYICEIFEGQYDLDKLSKNEQELALKRHNKESIIDSMLLVYSQIIGKSN